MCGALRGQKGAPDPLDWEYIVWVLGTLGLLPMLSPTVHLSDELSLYP